MNLPKPSFVHLVVTPENAVVARRGEVVLQVQVVGLARIADDVTPELARAAIDSVTVLGAFQASPAADVRKSDSKDHFFLT